jgi:hypothetical protein
MVIRKRVKKEFDMKTFISILIGGALSTVSAFAGAVATPSTAAGSDHTMGTPQVPFRPVQKRPSGARQTAAAAPKANIAVPQLPFRPVPKYPTGTSSKKPSGVETANRQ